ncbi:unnamed protein product [Cylindrotheca closterium]|uniref:Uncharacterized protein n=1 Tax=Cylindrotheca closterium TaxID=2856 RepID=A0AAD2FKA4_9STRA|nr:unnamed protein product [Cylindrotheca closterium]
MASSNPEHQIGARVSTRAILVTRLAECKRRYGSNAKSKVDFGVVEEVVCGKAKTGRANYAIKARWTLDHVINHFWVYVTDFVVIHIPAYGALFTLKNSICDA